MPERVPLRGCGCRPFVMSSGAIYHAAHCPEFPNQRLTKAEGEAWRMQNRAILREKRALKAALEDHPASGDKMPLRSVKDPDYVGAHMDDDDD